MITTLDKIFNKKIIVNCENEPYLTRWYILKTKLLSIYLHYFHRSDEDSCLHCHPFSFITFILWRGYNEYTENSVKRKYPGFIMYRPATWKHRVELIDNKTAITLVLRFKSVRDWGFYPGGKFVNWRNWHKDNCGDSDIPQDFIESMNDFKHGRVSEMNENKLI